MTIGPGPFEREPARDRPDSPPETYGVPQSGGEWIPWEHVIGRLSDSSAYWLATVTPAGRPHVVPVWGCVIEGHLFLETGDPGTVKNRNLAANAEVVVHLDDVDDAVIVRGHAQAFIPGPLGPLVAAAMHAKYREYDPAPDSWDAGGMYEVIPRTVLAWKAMPTATRWRFDRR
jgi:hypothetical protein